jgi:hypothetical protein
VSQERQAKERKCVWVETTILGVSQFCAWEVNKEKETELGDDATMEGEF